MTKGTPASSQIIFLEQKVAELEEQIDAFEMDAGHAASRINVLTAVLSEIEQKLDFLLEQGEEPSYEELNLWRSLARVAMEEK